MAHWPETSENVFRPPNHKNNYLPQNIHESFWTVLSATRPARVVWFVFWLDQNAVLFLSVALWECVLRIPRRSQTTMHWKFWSGSFDQRYPLTVVPLPKPEDHWKFSPNGLAGQLSVKMHLCLLLDSGVAKNLPDWSCWSCWSVTEKVNDKALWFYCVLFC